MNKTYREGALGALLDEYERVSKELKQTIRDVKEEDFKRIIDGKTKDPNCSSIQTIITHTINAGYGYVFHIRKNLGDPQAVREKTETSQNAQEACAKLDKMTAFTIDTLSKNYTPDFEEVLEKEFNVPWRQNYDFEQMLEHAIVHIMRHRRQIEKFKIKLKSIPPLPIDL